MKAKEDAKWRGVVSNPCLQHINIRSRAFRLFTTTSTYLFGIRKETISCVWLQRWNVVAGVNPHRSTPYQYMQATFVINLHYWPHFVWLTTAKNVAYYHQKCSHSECLTKMVFYNVAHLNSLLLEINVNYGIQLYFRISLTVTASLHNDLE